MRMMHHGDLPYAVAAEKAAAKTRAKFEGQIARGATEAKQVIQTMQERQPEDNFLYHDEIIFDPDYKQLRVLKKDDDKFDPLTFHRQALGQAARIANIPLTYVDRMEAAGQYDLIATNFNRRFHDLEPTSKDHRKRRFNFRAVQKQAMGVVSDTFPLWDSNRLVEAFIEAVMQYSGKIVFARYTDRRWEFKAVVPTIFEPIDNQPMLIGMTFRSSDYGFAKVDLAGLVDILMCTNLMTSKSEFSRKHFGTRYEEDCDYNREIREKSESLLVDKLKWHVGSFLSPANVQQQVSVIRKANEEELTAKGVHGILEGLVKRGTNPLTKDEMEATKKLYRSADTELMPRGDTKWRLANALSLMSQQVDPDRAMDLEQMAGEMVGLRDKVEEKK